MKFISALLLIAFTLPSFAMDMTGQAINGTISSRSEKIKMICINVDCTGIKFVHESKNGDVQDISASYKTEAFQKKVSVLAKNSHRPGVFPVSEAFLGLEEQYGYLLLVTFFTPLVVTGLADLVSYPVRASLGNKEYRVLKSIKRSLGDDINVSYKKFRNIKEFLLSLK